MPAEYVLGVDAGNTKTIALIAQANGTISGVGRGGCGDIYGNVSAAAALNEVQHAVYAAVRNAGIATDAIAMACFSMAGADWPEDLEFLQGELARSGFGRRISVVNDAVGALYAGVPGGIGVVQVCGTGAATAARNAAGQLWHSSFWQDGQGAREMASRALRAVYRAELGVAPPTALRDAALSFFGQDSVEAILHILTARSVAVRPGIDAFARVLLDVALAGDSTALEIVQTQGQSLGNSIIAAARQVQLEGTPFTLILSGGVLRHPSHLLTEAIINRVRCTSPDVVAINSRFEPAIGALFIALEAAGTAINDRLLETLVPSLPPHSLFATT